MKNVYLIGFMGVGKSTIGRLLAERLKMKFYDTDELVKARVGRSIADIFAGEGEARFRELERQIVEEISQRDGQVIALGGGAPLNGDNWQAISSTGVTIYLRAGASALFNRLKDEGSRPLLAGLDGQERLERIRSLLEIREPYYRQADLIIECRERSATELVEEIVERCAPSRLS